MKQITFITILLFGILTISAQERTENIREKIESQKIAFLSAQLELTPEISQDFWPLYNAYKLELNALKDGKKEFAEESNTNDPDAVLEFMIQHEEDALTLKKKYVAEMKLVIGSEKTLKFFRFDRQFKERMLRGLGQKRMKMQKKGR